MKKPYDKASIYQLALRTFTPEGTLKAAEKMLPYLAELGPPYIQFCALQTEDDDMDQSFWSARQKASRTGNPKNSYKPRDYYHVDEEYGCDQDLKDFIHTTNIRAMNPRAYIYLEDTDGNAEDFSENEPLPYDLDAPVVEIRPEDFGFTRAQKSDIVGGTPEQNAAVARDILANKKGPKYDIVMMNAGAAIYIGGKADSIAEGINLAKELVASGAAKKKLDEFIELSNK